MSLELAEKKIILANLQANEGNRSKTADDLKISLRGLRNKLWVYGVIFPSSHEPK